MENSQQHNVFTERRVMSRIDATLRINYQVISEQQAFHDPYDPHFVLPRYFLLLAELDQFDHALHYELEQFSQQHQHMGRILSLFNKKINLITGSLYDNIVQSVPTPERVNISESGLSFFTPEPIASGSYLHVTLSHPENFFHIAVTAHVVYSNQQDDSYRTGAYFITLHPTDRDKLKACIEQH